MNEYQIWNVSKIFCCALVSAEFLVELEAVKGYSMICTLHLFKSSFRTPETHPGYINALPWLTLYLLTFSVEIWKWDPVAHTIQHIHYLRSYDTCNFLWIFSQLINTDAVTFSTNHSHLVSVRNIWLQFLWNILHLFALRRCCLPELNRYVPTILVWCIQVQLQLFLTARLRCLIFSFISYGGCK